MIDIPYVVISQPVHQPGTVIFINFMKVFPLNELYS